MNSRQLHSSEAGSSDIALFVSVFSALFLFIVITATLVTFILPETYLGRARVKVPIENVVTRTNYDPTFIPTETEVIQSELVLGPVIQSLNLNSEWGKKYGGGQPLKTWETMQFLKKSLEVKSIQNTTLIEVTVFNDRPDEAAKMANAVAESYVTFRSKSISVTGVIQNANERPMITDRAVPNPDPVRPKKALNIAIGCLLGTALGGAAGFLVVAVRKAFAKK
jgi:capsular polysaccharide biosynthesis protein